jgi:hypothetical protein
VRVDDAFRVGVLTGVLSACLVEGARFLLKHRQAVLNLLHRKGLKYSHLSGEWYQYHVTRDREVSPDPIWVVHKDVWKVSPLLHVTGESENRHQSKLKYAIRGAICRGRLRLRYLNTIADEDDVAVTVDNLLSRDILFGVYVGYNFDKGLTAAPILFCQKELTDADLARALRHYDDVILRAPGTAAGPARP